MPERGASRPPPRTDRGRLTEAPIDTVRQYDDAGVGGCQMAAAIRRVPEAGTKDVSD